MENTFLFLREEGVLPSELEPPTTTTHPFPLPTDTPPIVGYPHLSPPNYQAKKP